jgi:hypothetical protein
MKVGDKRREPYMFPPQIKEPYMEGAIFFVGER